MENKKPAHSPVLLLVAEKIQALIRWHARLRNLTMRLPLYCSPLLLLAVVQGAVSGPDAEVGFEPLTRRLMALGIPEPVLDLPIIVAGLLLNGVILLCALITPASKILAAFFSGEVLVTIKAIFSAAPILVGVVLLLLLHARVLCPLGRWLAGRADVLAEWARHGRLQRRGQSAMPVQARDQAASEQDLAYRVQRPRLTFKDMHGMAELKAKLLEAGRAGLRRDGPASNGVLLHGKPGNGKTALAEALAGELGVGFLSVSIADLQSKWIGQTTEQLVAAFRCAQAQAPCVLLIDEIDSIIPNRASAGSSSEEGPKITNAFLTEVVRLRGRGVVVMAATNFLDRLDPAAIREGRFDTKIEVTPPDLPARIGLLTSAIRDRDPGLRVVTAELEAVARRWQGFSVARLRAVGSEAAKIAGQGEQQEVGAGHLMQALRDIQARVSSLSESAKRLDDLHLKHEQMEVLRGLAWRMRSPLEAEGLGATVPDGVLFAGPPGTGKTEAVRALARETGWALFVVSGSELCRDPARMEQLHAQAEDARPAIIFIDEADEVIANRQYSPHAGATNRLLTVMDGAHGKTPDILYIAATNNPAQIDPAMLRGGRFTEKLHFEVPGEDGLERVIGDWLSAKGWRCAEDLPTVARHLAGLSVANVHAVLQSALNTQATRAALAGRKPDPVIGPEALQQALSSVVPTFA